MSFINEGFDRAAFETAIAQWVLRGTELPVGKVYWADQLDGARPEAPAIALRLTSENDDVLPWLDTEENYLNPGNKIVVSITGSVFTTAAHGLLTGDGPFTMTSTGVLPGGVTAGTEYWVVVTSPTSFALALSFQNAFALSPTTITLTGSGSGVATLVDGGDVLRAGQELLYCSRSEDRFILTLECWATNGVSQTAAQNFLRRLISRSALPSMQDILFAARVGLNQFDRIRFTKGIRDAVRVEPRAYLEVRLNTPSESSETGGIIQVAQVTNLTTGTETDVDGAQ